MKRVERISYILIALLLLSCAQSSKNSTQSVFRIAHPDITSDLNEKEGSVAVVPLVEVLLKKSVKNDCDSTDTIDTHLNCVEVNSSTLAFEYNTLLRELADTLFPRLELFELIPGVDNVPEQDTVLDSLIVELKKEFPIEYYQAMDSAVYIADEQISMASRRIISQIAARYQSEFLIIPLFVGVSLNLENKHNGEVQIEMLLSIWKGPQAKMEYLHYSKVRNGISQKVADRGLLKHIMKDVIVDIDQVEETIK